MKKFPLTFLLLFLATWLWCQEYYMVVGTYNSPKSEGIYVYLFDSKQGNAKPVSQTKAVNPSFLAVSPNEKFVYAVNETGDTAKFTGAVSSYTFNKSNGALQLINQQSTIGNNPCYVSADKNGKWVFAANYSSGNMVILPVKDDGSLGPVVMNQPYNGSGPDKSRQLTSHAHFVSIAKDNRDLFVTDLGSDNIYIEHFHEKTGHIFNTEHQTIQVEPGGGPRHLDIDAQSRFIYLLEELTGYISVYTYPGKEKPALIQRIRSTPDSYTGKEGSADIHLSPDGKFLYTSNRGESNTIAIFSVDRKNGTLSLKGHQSTMGKTPRNFNFDPTGKFLLVANQNSDEIVVFKRNIRTGMLTDTGNRVSVGKPVCIKWISAN